MVQKLQIEFKYSTFKATEQCTLWDNINNSKSLNISANIWIGIHMENIEKCSCDKLFF